MSSSPARCVRTHADLDDDGHLSASTERQSGDQPTSTPVTTTWSSSRSAATASTAADGRAGAHDEAQRQRLGGGARVTPRQGVQPQPRRWPGRAAGRGGRHTAAIAGRGAHARPRRAGRGRVGRRRRRRRGGRTAACLDMWGSVLHCGNRETPASDYRTPVNVIEEPWRTTRQSAASRRSGTPSTAAPARERRALLRGADGGGGLLLRLARCSTTATSPRRSSTRGSGSCPTSRRRPTTRCCLGTSSCTTCSTRGSPRSRRRHGPAARPRQR